MAQPLCVMWLGLLILSWVMRKSKQRQGDSLQPGRQDDVWQLEWVLEGRGHGRHASITGNHWSKLMLASAAIQTEMPQRKHGILKQDQMQKKTVVGSDSGKMTGIVIPLVSSPSMTLQAFLSFPPCNPDHRFPWSCDFPLLGLHSFSLSCMALGGTQNVACSRIVLCMRAHLTSDGKNFCQSRCVSAQPQHS